MLAIQSSAVKGQSAGLDQFAHITNAHFLDTIVDGKTTDLWVCNFAVNPNEAGPKEWKGSPYRNPRAVSAKLRDVPGRNTYFSCAELKFGGSRRLENFVRMLVLVADDARTDDLEAPPSYVIRTSTDKVQIGYLLKDTLETRDLAQCKRAMKLLQARGLVGQDKSGNNAVRYVRLPVGTNTKYDDKPKHVLEVWNPELRYTLAEALAGFGVTLDAPAAPAEGAVSSAAVDASEWIDDAPGRLDVGQAEALIVSGESLHGPLASLAAHHAAKGLDADAIHVVLMGLMDRSAAKTDPLRADRWTSEVEKLRGDTVASAIKKFGQSYGTKVDFTDVGNVNLLARQSAGNLRYVVERKVWIVWIGGRWEVDSTREHAFAATGSVGEHYAKEGARLALELRGMDSGAAKRHQKTIDAIGAWEKACRGRRGIENMLALASMHPAFVIAESKLDTDPHLLGVQNGVVDLRTGTLRPDAREDFVTRRCAYPYQPGAKSPRWTRFVSEVTAYPIEALRDADGEIVAGTVGRFSPRPGYADYLQRSLGYSCTGVTLEHKMHTVFGEHGSNGKNALFDSVKRVLGDYAMTANEKLLLASRRETDANSATPALMALKGSRLAVASEPPANSTFDNTVIKALTGEVKVSGRALHSGTGEIAVTWHLWLLCNAKPKVAHLEQAVVGRVLMLPFDMRWNRPAHPEHDPALPDADKHLAQAFLLESEGILAWLVEGAVRYFKEGLAPCDEVVAATRTYFDEQRVDPVGQWLDEHERCPAAVGEPASTLFASFSSWRMAHEAAGSLQGGESPLTQTAFSLALKKRHKVDSTKQGSVRYGVRLTDGFDPIPDAKAATEYARLVASFGDIA